MVWQEDYRFKGVCHDLEIYREMTVVPRLDTMIVDDVIVQTG